MPMKRWIWWPCIELTMSRVPSTRGRPVAFRLMSGPRALMTACPRRTASRRGYHCGCCDGGAADDGGDVTGEPGDGLHDLSPMILTGAPQRAGAPAWRTSRSRSGNPDGALALGVVRGERSERIRRLVELVGLLDRHP